MKKRIIFRRPDIGMFLVLVAGLFFGSCAMAQINTEILLDNTACTAKFATTNCRGGMYPNGDICVPPSQAPVLQFMIQPPIPPGARIKRMDIGRNSDGLCPGNTGIDFPQFTNCSYAPANPAPALIIHNKNQIERLWFYSLTVVSTNCTADITIHPLISNGGTK
jgi:hypothetical protein